MDFLLWMTHTRPIQNIQITHIIFLPICKSKLAVCLNLKFWNKIMQSTLLMKNKRKKSKKRSLPLRKPPLGMGMVMVMVMVPLTLHKSLPLGMVMGMATVPLKKLNQLSSSQTPLQRTQLSRRRSNLNFWRIKTSTRRKHPFWGRSLRNQNKTWNIIKSSMFANSNILWSTWIGFTLWALLKNQAKKSQSGSLNARSVIPTLRTTSGITDAISAKKIIVPNVWPRIKRTPSTKTKNWLSTARKGSMTLKTTSSYLSMKSPWSQN